MGETLVVTGVSGLVGRRLAREVLNPDDAGFDRVIGVDVVRSEEFDDLDGFEFREADVRDDVIGEILDEGDALAHLAFVTDPARDEEEMWSVNVDGTRNVLESAVASEVGRIAYLSSAVAYGGHPDNDFPLTEESPLRANPDFSYAEHKLEVERWLASWRRAHPDLALAVLRPAIVAGRGADNFITRQMELPRIPTVRGYRPPWQFVHVDDLVSAIIHALSHGLDGPYNVAPEGWLSHDEVVGLASRRPIELPEEVAFTVVERLWQLGIAEAPPGQLHYLMHPFVLSVTKLIATGWQPEHTNREAFTELVADHEPYIAVRRGVRMRKRSLGIGAGLAGAGLAVLAVRWLRDGER